jgi:menaquinone-9 beta-reductase
VRRFAGRLNKEYRELLAGYPQLAGACLVDEPKVAGPFPRTSQRAWRANLVLAGDAAGFFDAISGEGMSVALVGARSCAGAISAHLQTGAYERLRDYDRQRRTLVRNSDLLARFSLLLGSRDWTARVAVRNLARRPEAFAKLVTINTGEAPLTSLRPRDLSALLAGI